MHESVGVWPYSARMHFSWDISHPTKLKYAFFFSFPPIPCQFFSICLFCLSLKREHMFSGRFFVTYLVWYKEKKIMKPCPANYQYLLLQIWFVSPEWLPPQLMWYIPVCRSLVRGCWEPWLGLQRAAALWVSSRNSVRFWQQPRRSFKPCQCFREGGE